MARRATFCAIGQNRNIEAGGVFQPLVRRFNVRARRVFARHRNAMRTRGPLIAYRGKMNGGRP